MIDSNEPASRRNWLGWLSAASLGSGLLAAAPAPADGTAPGTRVYNIVDFGAKGDGTDPRYRGGASGHRCVP